MGQKGIHTGGIIPVYPETAGISSKWLRRRIHDAYNLVKLQLSEFLPRETLKVNSLLNFDDAISKVHFPKNTSKTGVGLKRLAFNELLFLQMQSLKRKRQWQKNKVAAKLKVDSTSMNQFIEVLPFKLTASQEKAIGEILVDLKRDYPMNRLLEGDVGSGKTVVAATGAFLSFTNGYQTVFMVPTQILAQQHYETLDIGRTDIFIGTHALIHNKVGFDQVALVVIDEQHRFGVEQRAHLTKIVGGKKSAPHVLTMTATPIPRTIALTFYGDLDLSTLNEIPAGRQKITTWIVPPEKREGAYQWIKSQITSTKSQIFVVCPLIEESDKETLAAVKAATGHYEDLKKVFKDLNIGLLHGRMKVKEKNKVLGNFRSRRIDILVATPVVEVGIDVPNATIMVIEASERFGLAQLHQLRGRVGRGEKKSYCLLFSESKSPKAFSRLSAMTKTISGFELAEMDLRLRGPGEIFGVAQHGFPELKIAKWTDIELIKKARQVAT
ncbi:MAG: ATP-dependent DNA helicase RecG, partial [Candidatus Woesebacteria bacterium GW2011_GWB1_40_101]